MKGIVLAGGTGSRLEPLTKVTNKHLLPVYDKPMIYYPLETLIRAGIKDILIISGPGHAGHFLNLLGSGREFGVNLTYEIQEEAGGIAQALGLARDFADEEKIAVILGDNIFVDNFAAPMQDFARHQDGSMIFIKEVADPERFGVASVEGDKITKIEEKPKNPATNLAVTGLYLYDNHVFEIIKTLKPSDRGELEITDVNNHYIKDKKMKFAMVKNNWTDAGTFKSLFRANKIMAEKNES
ncbi:MAG: sugar phosphate nucleotidyltransferase [Patescibacteria group bacterium]|nr:sugar phosphate nucleotidyltransferase [Patescibacteria group bacterium]